MEFVFQVSMFVGKKIKPTVSMDVVFQVSMFVGKKIKPTVEKMCRKI